jgi:hypothetical protein
VNTVSHFAASFPAAQGDSSSSHHVAHPVTTEKIGILILIRYRNDHFTSLPTHRFFYNLTVDLGFTRS